MALDIQEQTCWPGCCKASKVSLGAPQKPRPNVARSGQAAQEMEALTLLQGNKADCPVCAAADDVAVPGILCSLRRSRQSHNLQQQVHLGFPPLSLLQSELQSHQLGTELNNLD